MRTEKHLRDVTYPLYLYLAEENAKTVAGHTETDVVRHIQRGMAQQTQMMWNERVMRECEQHKYKYM